LLNSVAVAERIPHGVSVIDVGAGAGLPGVPLAIARPDLTVTLLEPQLRRTVFLDQARVALSLDNVTVLRCRAEESAGRVTPADVVTARAVAPLDRLVRWCLPLTAADGRVLAIKGAAAAEEVAIHSAAIRRAGGSDPVVCHCGEGILEEPARVVQVLRRRGPR
ncbi:MAG: 16S rRNA (guanine(527)-N(7))-methyltransferase RsmG, partial [Micromonosporaceae bacterium]